MCDYSLEMYASRPARFEKYVTTRFPSGSIGLAAPGDCRTAVCIQYDTPLKLEGISNDLQMRLGWLFGISSLRAASIWRLPGWRHIRQRKENFTAACGLERHYHT